MAQIVIEVPENLLYHCIELVHELRSKASKSKEKRAKDDHWDVSGVIALVLDHHFHCSGVPIEMYGEEIDIPRCSDAAPA